MKGGKAAAAAEIESAKHRPKHDTPALALGTRSLANSTYARSLTGRCRYIMNNTAVEDSSKRIWQAHRFPTCNITLVKAPKCASTTLAFIAQHLAIARKMQGAFTTFQGSQATGWHFVSKEHILQRGACGARFDHALASTYGLRGHRRPQTFAFTFMRGPISQVVSSIEYFFLTQGPTWRPHPASEIPNFLAKKHNPQRAYIEPWPGATLPDILATYDFIGVVERLFESLAVMKHLLGLERNEITWVACENSGISIDGNPITRLNRSREVQHYLNTWAAVHAVSDAKLYKMVDDSLSLTIQNIGPMKIAKDVSNLKQDVAQLREWCLKSGTCTLGSHDAFDCATRCLLNHSGPAGRAVRPE